MDLPFTAHLHVPTDLCPTFSSYKPESIFGTLETISELLDPCPARVSLTEIIRFSLHHCLSLCLWILSVVSG